ncbi:MAG: c-type cytochrome [Anaerolineae bacterium]|nr:c-type cytochrome [Anaerolineae bacterium]
MAEKTKPKTYVRFTASQRFEHLVLLVSFSVLALTGIPQKYASHDWAKTMIDVLGGIESIRIVHRMMAVLLIIDSIYHGCIIAYKIIVRGSRLTMAPTLKDARDVWDWLRFNLGFKREHPHMPRFNFGEKAEYLAVVWGTLLMALTGFMLWNPIATTQILPGEWIPAARAAHGAEAVLAVLSILSWHMYNVHLKRFNKSMFTGKISREEMVEEHGAELAELENPKQPRRLEIPPEILAKRERFFWRFAIVVSAVIVAALLWFVTFEDSAITTVPRLSAVGDITTDIDPAEVGDPAKGPDIWQKLDCASCHGERAEGISVRGLPLAGTSLSFESFVISVRRGPAEMPGFNAGQVSDEELAHLWLWLIALPAPGTR